MSHSQFVLEPCAYCLPPGFRAGFGRRGVLGLAAGLASANDDDSVFGHALSSPTHARA